MNKYSLFLLSALTCLSACNTAEPDISISIDLQSHEADVSENLYGIFFEEINHAGEGGLYGELLQNRSFEDKVLPEGYRIENGSLVPFETINYGTGRVTPRSYAWPKEDIPGWELELKEGAKITSDVVTTKPNFSTAPSSLQICIEEIGQGAALVNRGFWGIHYEQGKQYRLRLWLRTELAKSTEPLTVNLIGQDSEVLGTASLQIANDGLWHEYTAEITSNGDAPAGKLSIVLPSVGRYYFDYVSLFAKDTFRGRENGMRRDVAEMIEKLKPAFVRWPGGCVVEGITLNNRLDWKKTLGDPASRPGEYDSWGYRNSYGMGYKEFLDFCEDLGAKGMFVCNVGMACTGRTGEVCTESEIQYYIDDVLNAIEYAIGDTTTTWGRRRAHEGHPSPYPLAYVEIGNENFGPIYDHRYPMFREAIHNRYPQLTLISNYGMEGAGKIPTDDMIDPHWYVKPEHFFSNTTQFDNYDRQAPKVYVGEYACNDGVGTGCMLAALSEAAFLTSVERNADVVRMASYAPLFEHEHDRAWPVNLIWISSDKVVGRSSYYVQQMFANNRPSYNLSTTADIKAENERQAFLDQPSFFGLGSIDTQAEFRNVCITRAGKTTQFSASDATEDWQPVAEEHRKAMIWKNDKLYAGDTVEFEVNTKGGKEQFAFFFDLKRFDLQEGGRFITFGTADNTATCVEGFYGETSRWTTIAPQSLPSSIAPDQWHRVRICFLTDGIKAEVDGEEVFAYQTDIKQRKFYAAGYNSATDEIIIKLINANGRKCKAHIDLNGADVARKGRVITLQSASAEDENSYEQPLLIRPVETEFDDFGSSFDYEMPSYSLTILRIKKK